VGYGFEAKLLQNSTTREEEVRDLTGQSRGASGRKTKPGVEMPMTIYRDGEAMDFCASNQASAAGFSRDRVCIEDYPLPLRERADRATRDQVRANGAPFTQREPVYEQIVALRPCCAPMLWAFTILTAGQYYQFKLHLTGDNTVR
jgi:hypothetical protein